MPGSPRLYVSTMSDASQGVCLGVAPAIKCKVPGPAGIRNRCWATAQPSADGCRSRVNGLQSGIDLATPGSMGREAVQNGLALCVSEERMLPGLPMNITSANILLDKEFRPRVESVAHLFDAGRGHERT